MSSNNNGGSGSAKLWTPSNIITVVRICLVPVFVGALLAPWPEWWNMPAVTDDIKCVVAAGLFIIISGTDWLDGYLARKRNEVTDFGKFMDPLADKILVTAALICLVELHTLPTWVVLIILAREFIVSGLRMMAAAKGVVIAASHLGKFKTVFQMAAIVLFTLKDLWESFSPEGIVPIEIYVFSWIIMGIALVLTVISLVDYLAKSRAIIGVGSSDEESTDEGETLQSAEDIAYEVVELATKNEFTLGTAESLTGGSIGRAITEIPGASNVFAGGIISYTNNVKEDVLGVSASILENEGAVSEECALSMAEGARRILNCNYAVSVTGIAGPTGAEPGKPVGTVWIGLSGTSGTKAERFIFDGDREAVRQKTVETALNLLRDRMASDAECC